MIDHVVLFKLKPDAAENQIDAMIAALESLTKVIPELLEIHVRRNFADRSQGYGLMLTSRFQSKEHLRIYADHVEHKRVIAEFVTPVRESVIAGDIEY